MASPLNHNHLYYFWLAGKHRSLTKAAKELGLAQPTVSAQIRSLEQQLRVSLFARRGRTIDLTESGQIVFRYADEMFRISGELRGALVGRLTGETRVFNVGTSDFVPKPIVQRILEPLLLKDRDVRLVCREWRIDELLAELGLFQLDLVLADRPHPSSSRVHAISHPVMESAVAIFACAPLARRLRRGFPQSLSGAPLYLPVRNTALRESIDRWFEANNIRPVVLAEFEDCALLKTFGSGGHAAFPAIAMIEEEVRGQYGVERVGWVRGVREVYYAITVQRRLMHPTVQRLFAQATERLRKAPAIDGQRAAPKRRR